MFAPARCDSSCGYKRIVAEVKKGHSTTNLSCTQLAWTEQKAMANSKAPSLLVLVVAAISIGCNVEAISRFAGSCPSLDAVSFFNPNSFKGVWYEYGNFFPVFDDINRCSKFSFADPLFGVMSLDISGKNMLNFQTVTVSGSAAVTGSNGRLSVTFPPVAPLPTEYLVLGTDYSSWAVLWTCRNTQSDNIQNVIILTRLQAPPQFTVDSALRAIDSKNLSRFSFKPVDQSFC